MKHAHENIPIRPTQAPAIRRRMTTVLAVLSLAAATTVACGQPLRVEYSNHLDEQAIAGGDAHGALSPQQTLLTWPPDAPANGFPANRVNFGGNIDVDALGDEYDITALPILVDAADLLVSFTGDGGANAVYRERSGPPGLITLEWSHVALCNPDPPGNLEDVDGLAVHGWAQHFSEIGDPGGTSIWFFGTSWVPHATIVAAVNSLGCAAPAGDVDLDALMVQDMGSLGIWDGPDIVLFSIRPAGTFDGGELIVLPNGGPAYFLTHGGHLWDTAFNVSAAFGVSTEDVDAIDAMPSTAASCPADINGDGDVSVVDLLMLLAAWGNPGGPEDINGDGIVSVLDLLELLSAWGPCP